jgi:hypothetical protein
VSVSTAVALTLLVLAAAGVLPTLALVGPRLVAVPLAPLAGSVICAVSAGCCLAITGTLLGWFVAWSSVAAAVSVVALFGQPGRARRIMRDLRRGARPTVVVGAVAVLGAVAWTLRGLKVPTVGFDARSIWIIHARWFLQGHTFALAAVRNRFEVVTHPGYPPLVSSVMALAWRVSGTSSDRVAVVMVALLNGCAMAVAGWGVVEAARQGALRTHSDKSRQRRVIVVSIVVAVLVVVVAGGVIGTFATNGYADPLWSLSAVAVVMYGLAMEPSGSNLGVVAIVAGVAGLSKLEGIAVTIVLLVVIGVRLKLRVRPGAVPATRSGRGPRRFLVALGGGVLALLVWPILTTLLGVPTDPDISGRREGSLSSRTQGTFDAMVPHLHVVALAAICSALGFLVLRRVRTKFALGNDLWTWAALGGAALVLGGAYVVGPGNLDLWLATSVNRTTIFLALLAWWSVAVWAMCGTAGLLV